MTCSRPLIAASLLAAVLGCAGGSDPGSASSALPRPELPSCWRVEAADSSLTAAQRKTRLRLPWGMTLDTTAVDSARYRARSLDEEGRATSYPFAGWWPVAGSDSLELGHPSAFSGLRLRLAPGDSVMEGTAVPYSDVTGGAGSSAAALTVRARRVPCP